VPFILGCLIAPLCDHWKKIDPFIRVLEMKFGTFEQLNAKSRRLVDSVLCSFPVPARSQKEKGADVSSSVTWAEFGLSASSNGRSDHDKSGKKRKYFPLSKACLDIRLITLVMRWRGFGPKPAALRRIPSALSDERLQRFRSSIVQQVLHSRSHGIIGDVIAWT
jgi:hypothetical protein